MIILVGLAVQPDFARSQEAASDSSAHAPRQIAHDLWISKDKFDHALVSAGLVATQFYVLHQEMDLNSGRSRQIAAGSTLAIGIAKEIYDKISRRGTPSWKDLLADFAGVALAIVTMTQ
jgi:uncharacterized protein YfiM (DUF2279 family)